MRRTLTVVALLLATTACAGPSAAETAYLDVIRDRSSLIEIDEDEALNRGRTVCETLAAIKPEDRAVAASLLLDQGFAIWEINAATDHLCPEADYQL